MELLSGIINLKKEAGMSSHTAVSRVRRILNIRQVGHPGTLDPEATGVLPILVGNATKCSDYFLEIGKTYVGEATFGIRTDTQDTFGSVLETSDDRPTEDLLRKKIETFKGEIDQVPPMFSALKKDGVPLYKLARRGEEIEQAARKVNVYDIKLLEFDGEKAKIFVHCGRGTYIRTIINDLGEIVGCHAAMSALERTSYGNYSIEDAVTLETLAENPTAYIRPIDELFENEPKLKLSEENLRRYLQGKTVAVKTDKLRDEGNNLCLYTPEGVLFATASWKKREEDGRAVLLRDRFFGV